MLAKVFSALREEGLSKHDIAKLLSVDVREINELIFGLAVTAIASENQSAVSSAKVRPDLKLVT